MSVGLIITALISFVAACFDLILAGYLLGEDRRSMLHRLAAARSFVLAYVFFLSSFMVFAPNQTLATLAAQLIVFGIIIAAVNFHFVLEWIGQSHQRWAKLLIISLYAGFILIIGMRFLTGEWLQVRWDANYGWLMQSSQRTWQANASALYVALGLAVPMVLGVLFYYRLTDQEIRKQQRYICLGILLQVVLVICFDILPRLFGLTFPLLTSLWGLIGNLLIVYGIHRTRIFLLSPLTASQEIFRAVTQGIVLCNRQRQIVEFNPAFARISGYTVGELRDRSVTTMFRSTSTSTRLVDDTEMLLLVKQGSQLPVLVTEDPILDRTQQVVGWALIVTDISRRKRYEQALAIAFERERYLATTDQVTGLHNRRHFYTLALEAFVQSERTTLPLCVIFFDIDHFKHVNDTYGHAVGDQVLRLVAETAQSQLRQGDVIARHGGEEFAVLLPETNLDHASQIAERLRVAVEQATLMVEQQPVQVTISLGLASTSQDLDSIDHLIDRADTASYSAKRRGRNQLVVWQSAAELLNSNL